MKTLLKRWRLAWFVLLVLGFVLGAYLPVQAGPQADPGINKVYVDTVNDVAFTVSWTTDLASNGSVKWGTTTPPANTLSDAVASTTTHVVTVAGLSPNTTYYFEVTSDTATDNNGGAYYQVTTGPTVSTSPGNTVWGYVYQSDGSTPVPYAIVYMQLQDADGVGSLQPSQWVSARADSSGVWSFNLGNVRTADLQASYSFTNGVDKLRLVGQGGSAGTVGVDPDQFVVTTPATSPYQINLVLSQGTTAVRLNSFHSQEGLGLPAWSLAGLLAVGLAAGMVLRRRNRAAN